MGSRIDFTLMSTGIINCLDHIDYSSGYKTDHSMLLIKINVTEEARGPGYWKFNNTLLRDHDFVTKCNVIIDNATIKYADAMNSAERWELCKSDLVN